MPTTARRTCWLIVAAALAWLAGAPALAQGNEPAPHRLVIQVSDNDAQKWNLALNNARNVQDDFGGPEATELEIVVYGPGIGMLKSDSPVAKRGGRCVECRRQGGGLREHNEGTEAVVP